MDCCCFMITIKSDGSGENINTKEFSFEFTVSFPKDSVPSLRLLTLASEENSYGLTQKEWFDGELDVLRWNNTRGQEGVMFKIADVIEYQYLKSTCSQESYYQCLADRFVNFPPEKALLRSSVNYQHDTLWNRFCGNRTCSPVSLPFRENKLSICKSPNEKLCYQEPLEKMMLDQNKHCKPSCRIKEFKVVRGPRMPNPGGSKVIISFELPAATRRQLTKIPQKTVLKEYHVITGVAFLGNVGGMLGIFVSFSWLGMSEWILKVSEGIYMRIHKIR